MEDQESPDSKFTNESQFYEKANEYWSQIPPTIDGMLGGFGCISNTDIRGSELFLKKIFNVSNQCRFDNFSHMVIQNNLTNFFFLNFS